MTAPRATPVRLRRVVVDREPANDVLPRAMVLLCELDIRIRPASPTQHREQVAALVDLFPELARYRPRR